MAAENNTPETLSERLDEAREELQQLVEQTRKAARGALHRIEDSSSSVFEDLVRAGEQYQKQREKERRKQGRNTGVRERVADYLGLTTREDLEQLNKKLNTLSRKVRKIEKEAAQK